MGPSPPNPGSKIDARVASPPSSVFRFGSPILSNTLGFGVL